MAAFLLEMNGRVTAAGVMALRMSRRDIADYLGITLDTISRALSEICRVAKQGQSPDPARRSERSEDPALPS